MIISIVIPAYNASATIERTLISVFSPTLKTGWTLDVIIINDGSSDEVQLKNIVSFYSDVKYLSYSNNRGKCAAMNWAIHETVGDVVIILDADDELTGNWPETFSTIQITWPQTSQICFAAGKTQHNETTTSNPDYSGPLTFDDMLNDRYMGEYMPIFRGPALRANSGYIDLCEKTPCEFITYLTFAKESTLWISSEVMRIYHIDHAGSFTASISNPDHALSIAACYDAIFTKFHDDYNHFAPTQYRRRRLRQAVFFAIANARSEAFKALIKGISIYAPFDTVAAFILIMIGGKPAFKLIRLAKACGLIRKFG